MEYRVEPSQTNHWHCHVTQHSWCKNSASHKSPVMNQKVEDSKFRNRRAWILPFCSCWATCLVEGRHCWILKRRDGPSSHELRAAHWMSLHPLLDRREHGSVGFLELQKVNLCRLVKCQCSGATYKACARLVLWVSSELWVHCQMLSCSKMKPSHSSEMTYSHQLLVSASQEVSCLVMRVNPLNQRQDWLKPGLQNGKYAKFHFSESVVVWETIYQFTDFANLDTVVCCSLCFLLTVFTCCIAAEKMSESTGCYDIRIHRSKSCVGNSLLESWGGHTLAGHTSDRILHIYRLEYESISVVVNQF